MKRTISVLFLTSQLAACGAVGDVFTKTGQILMDPSIQVGSNDEQPSLVGLSLYAAPDVNPNPASLPDTDEAVTAMQTPSNREFDGPHEVKLKSANREEMIDSLRGLLDELEEGRPSLHPLRRMDTGPSTIRRTAADIVVSQLERPEEAVAELDLLEEVALSLHFLPGRVFGTSGGVIEQGFSGAPLPVDAKTPAMPDWGAEAEGGAGRGLGQYSLANRLPPADPKPAPRGAATPISFKVLQLKDDSLLLNADSMQLAKDLKKALGSTYVAEDDYVLQPGQFKFINFSRINPDTRYVAIVADFHDQNGAVWKQVFRLEPAGRKYALLMTLQGNRVTIVDESYRPPQPRSKP